MGASDAFSSTHDKYSSEGCFFVSFRADVLFRVEIIRLAQAPFRFAQVLFRFAQAPFYFAQSSFRFMQALFRFAQTSFRFK